MLVSPKATDLRIDGNPYYQKALEVARKAGAGYILNVTLNQDFKLTGIFARDLEVVYKQAVKQIKKYITIPLDKE